MQEPSIDLQAELETLQRVGECGDDPLAVSWIRQFPQATDGAVQRCCLSNDSRQAGCTASGVMSSKHVEERKQPKACVLAANPCSNMCHVSDGVLLSNSALGVTGRHGPEHTSWEPAGHLTCSTKQHNGCIC
jgi:hypothetical protein